MTYDEAMRALESGARVRRQRWNDESFMVREGGTVRVYIGGAPSSCSISDHEKLLSDWQLVGENH